MGVHSAYAQADMYGSSLYERALLRSRNYLSEILLRDLYLYNGIEHPGYLRTIKGIAYLNDDQMTEGQVQYNEVWYTLPMVYDLYADKLVIMHHDNSFRLSLINEKVSQFILHNRQFRYLPNEGTGNSRPLGLCEVLFEGDSVALFAKRRKLLNEQPGHQVIEREFIVSDQYYLKHRGAFHLIRSKGDMYALMNDKKKEVVAELRRSKVKFKKNREKALIIASRIYDEKI
ncbi:MAG: hypothetical protein ACO1NU_10065 [Arcticibacter sp.]